MPGARMDLRQPSSKALTGFRKVSCMILRQCTSQQQLQETLLSKWVSEHNDLGQSDCNSAKVLYIASGMHCTSTLPPWALSRTRAQNLEGVFSSSSPIHQELLWHLQKKKKSAISAQLALHCLAGTNCCLLACQVLLFVPVLCILAQLCVLGFNMTRDDQAGGKEVLMTHTASDDASPCNDNLRHQMAVRGASVSS